jgi:transcriptional regulator with XRE-family HTH domain
MSNLRVLREINNYTQEYVASQIGVDQSTYSKIERNPKIIRGEQAEKLAELYDVGVGDILSPGVTISFSNSTFSDKGYVHNLHEEIHNAALEKVIAAKDSEIKTIKEELEYLRKQNNQLLALLGEKR